MKELHQYGKNHEAGVKIPEVWKIQLNTSKSHWKCLSNGVMWLDSPFRQIQWAKPGIKPDDSVCKKIQVRNDQTWTKAGDGEKKVMLKREMKKMWVPTLWGGRRREKEFRMTPMFGSANRENESWHHWVYQRKWEETKAGHSESKARRGCSVDH